MRPFYITDEKVRARILDAIRQAPLGYKVMVGPGPRTLDQNAKCHAMLGEIGDRLDWKWAGVDIDIEDLKSVMVASFRKATGGKVRFVPGLDGELVLLNWRTRDFSKPEMSDFIEFLSAFMAEQEIA